MASALPPVKGVAFSFEHCLVSQSDTDTFQDNPTLAAGDVKIIKNGTLDGNIDTLPTAVTSLTRVITVALSADEMNADRVAVLFHDAAGSEWQDSLVTLYTSGQTLDTTDGVADAIKVKTDYLPSATAGASGGLPVLDANLAASANVTYLKGQSTPVDNLVLALGIGGLVEKLSSMLEAAGLAYQFTAEALAETPSGGLSAQQMRDAMMLAPSGGTPADGSVDAILDAIRAVTDEVDVSAVTVTTTNNAGEVTIKRSASFAATVSGLSIPADWLAVIWTVKGAASDDDDDAVIQVRASNPAAASDGLLVIESNAPGGSLSASSGYVTVDQPGGSVALALKAAATAVLAARGDAVWDLRVLRPPAGEADELTTGTADVVYTVTHART